MKIYTKKGDQGITSLYGGLQVPKSSLIISTLGAVDELNSYLGIILVTVKKLASGDRGNIYFEISEKLLRIQNSLFRAGAELSAKGNLPKKSGAPYGQISLKDTAEIEKEIDAWQKKLPELHNFILPGGNEPAAQLFFARSLCRHAERVLVMLQDQNEFNRKLDALLIFFNRLSDWFFVLARLCNQAEKQKEVIWKGG